MDIKMIDLIDQIREGKQVEVELEEDDDFGLHLKAVEDILYAFEIDYVVYEDRYGLATEDEGGVIFWRE